MKPYFALNLTHDSIGLLHRTSKGWLEVGVAAFDAPDLGEALTYLRRSALGLSPAGFTTKLVIPNSQILYDELDAPGPTDAERIVQIRAALEGRTPYDVADLVFDWTGDGSRVKVAVVARETLDEAEQFAVQHRFQPVSFVAIPDDADFYTEPYFGATQFAASHLPEGVLPERDAEPLMIVAREMPRGDVPMAAALTQDAALAEAAAQMPAALPDADSTTAETDAAEESATGEQTDVAVESALAPTIQTEAENLPAKLSDEPVVNPLDLTNPLPEPTESTASVEVEAEAEAEAEAEVEVEVEDEVEVEAASHAAVEEEPAPVFETQAADAADLAQALNLANATYDETKVDPIDAAADPGLFDLDFDPDEAPVALDVEDDQDETDTTGTLKLVDAIPVEPGPVTPTFASRRPQVADVPPVAKAADPIAAPPPLTKPAAAPLPSGVAERRAEILGKENIDKPVAKAPAVLSAPAIPGLTAERRAKVTPTTPIADPRKSLPPAKTSRALGEVGLGGRPLPQRGKPRFLGLILTGVLLLLLAMVAAWSSFYLASDDTAPADDTAVVENSGDVTQPPPVETASADPQPAAEDADVASLLEAAEDPQSVVAADAADAQPLTEQPAPADEAAADGEMPTPVDEAAADGAGLAPQAEIDPEALADGESAPVEVPAAADTNAVAVAAELAARSAAETASNVPSVTEDTASLSSAGAATVEQSSAPAPTASAQPDGQQLAAPALTVDQIVLAAPDAMPKAGTTLGLPEATTQPDAMPVAQGAPPPFGTQFVFDADGRIKPTPEGVVTPDGYTLIAGKPDKLPPPRPASLPPLNAVAADPPATADAGTANPAAAATLLTDTDTTAAPLPTAAMPPDPAAANVAALPVPADPALAGVKPQRRPESLTPASVPAVADPATDPAAAGNAAEAQDETALEPAPVDTRLTGARPMARPQSIADLAAAARDETQLASLASDTAPLPGSGSKLAIAISGRPAPRPDNFSKAVEAAVADAVRDATIEVAAAEPPAQEAAIRVRKPEPTEDEQAGNTRTEAEADSEPEVAPKRGSHELSGTVAKKATFANAFNLSKTGLIGLGGASNNRWALIRQSNGRVKKVFVGDRIEGSTVAAITANEVRLQKGKRLVELSMPRG